MSASVVSPGGHPQPTLAAPPNTASSGPSVANSRRQASNADLVSMQNC